MYHDLITEKSWQLLQELKRNHQFILIGGWAVYLYTHALKSKDIDIVVEYEELARLRDHHELQKNENLKKYEIHIEGIDIDIYVPFFSDLGIPAEAIAQFTTVQEGFTVPVKEVLLILKQKAWHDRGHSLKGEKDKLDIMGLIAKEIDWKKFKILIQQFNLSKDIISLKALLNSMTEVPELNLNAHTYSRLKKRVLAVL